MAGEKILIADDSAQIRMMVRDALVIDGYTFVEAADGAQALEVVISERPDAMLLDLAMPELDGFEVLRFMDGRPEAANTRVIMLTGAADSGNLEYGYTLGAVGYIVKPFAADELRAAVVRALGLPR